MEQTGSRPTTENEGQLEEIVRRLVAAYRPERVYLFGSRARGDSDSDSDYDILLVVDDNAPSESRRSRLAREILWGTGIAADVLILTRTGSEGSLGVRASLPATVLREGSRAMSPDPALATASRAWLGKASRDLAAGGYERTASSPFTGDAVFHAQQAVEKRLEALLTRHGRRIGGMSWLIRGEGSGDDRRGPPWVAFRGFG